MPTGYTAELMKKGMSFQKFVMNCARAFGALITIRDDPMDAPIPIKFEPSDYHEKESAKAREKLARLQKMDQAEKIAFGEKEKNADLKQLSEWLTKEETENHRLEEMEAQVKAWTPPTPDHEELKNFMLQQIKISKHDSDYIRRRLKEATDSPPMCYYTKAVSDSARSINYYTEEYQKEIERVNSRNEWLKQLRESISK